MLGAMIIVFFMLGGGLIAAMLNMESEIVNGPNRPLREIASSEDSWLIEDGTTNLVDDSFVPSEVVSQLRSDGYDAIGFSKTYRSVQFNGSSRQVIVFDVPADLSEGKPGVVVDDSIGLSIGDSFEMNGEAFIVTGLTTGTSSLGKEAIFLDEVQFQRLGMNPELLSGAFIKGSHVGGSYADSYAVYTADEFEQVNLDYWVANGGGLPLLLATNAQIYSIAVVMCVVALGFVLTKRSIILQRSIGMTNLQAAATEALYLAVLWLISIPFQWTMYWLLVGQFKSSTTGYDGQLSVAEFTLGSAGMLLVVVLYFVAMMMYSRRALRSQMLAAKLASS